MEEGVPVGIHKSEWVGILRRLPLGAALMIAFSFLAIFLWISFVNYGLGVAFFVTGASALVGFIGYFKSRHKLRRYVVDTGSGFHYLGGSERLTINDEQIVAIRLEQIEKCHDEEFQFTFRCFEVWTDLQQAPIRMSNSIPASDADPLAGMISRIKDNLTERTAVLLAAGGTLSGGGWRVEGTTIIVPANGHCLTIPFSEIETTALCEATFGIWRTGETEPVTAIPFNSLNAPILFSLLCDWIDVRREFTELQRSQHGPVSDSDFGRLLFARRHGEWSEATAIAAFLFATVAGVLIFSEDLRYYAIACAGMAAALFPLYLCVPVAYFRCYEKGISWSVGKREQGINYRDIYEFTYRATSGHVRSRPLGITFRFTAKSPTVTIHFEKNLPANDEQFHEACEFIAEKVAGRMLDDLQAGRAVAWMPDVTLLPHGIWIHSTEQGKATSSECEIVPYGSLVLLNDEGVFLVILDRRGSGKTIYKCSMGCPNFRPGYLALLKLTAARSQGPFDILPNG